MDVVFATKRQELQEAYDHLSEYIRRLRIDLVLAPRGSEQYELEVKLQRAEKEREELSAKLDELSLQQDPKGLERRQNLESRYLQELIARYRDLQNVYMDLSMSSSSRSRPLRLKPTAKPFIDMQAGLFRNIKFDLDDDRSQVILMDSFHDLAAMIHVFERVALIGDPGCGKTTTLQRLVLHFAQEAKESPQALLPVYLELGKYSGGDLLAFAAASTGGLHLQDYLPRNVILMLDGLNEVPRGSALRDLNLWLEEHPSVPLIVSCRKLDYIERKLPLQRMDIEPLDVRRIREFITNFVEEETPDTLFWQLAGSEASRAWEWYRRERPGAPFDEFWYGHTEHVHTWEIERQQVKRIQDDLRERGQMPGLLGMVSNPFLLVGVIISAERKQGLPKNRSQLFTEFVQSLMDIRGRKAASTEHPWIDERIQIRALSVLAHRMQSERLGTSVAVDWVRRVIGAALPAHNPDEILYFAASATLVELSTSTVRFRHQLMQEYFAALEMADNIRLGYPASLYWPSDKWWEQTGWEETVTFVAGLTEDATDVVKWLLPVQPDLAFRCATESGVRCDQVVLKELYIPREDTRKSPIARAAWGRLIAYRDPRAGIGIDSSGLPQIEWCQVPRGRFQMGGSTELPSGVTLPRAFLWPGRSLLLPYSFWVSKYPITYAQFEPFVAEGYNTERYWTRAGWEWKRNQRFPLYWEDPQYHLPNHPVIGVTYYEVLAYSNWLNERFHVAKADVPATHDDWTIRLPTESEWERCARFPDGRRYPWGDHYIPGYANVDERFENAEVGPYYLRGTTAVGLYSHGASPNGAYDLSGNIYEWCVSKWRDPFIFPEDNDPEGSDFRCIRGGSWYNAYMFAMGLVRDHLDPDISVFDIGFRVVLVPSPSLRTRLRRWLMQEFIWPSEQIGVSRHRLFITGLPETGKQVFMNSTSYFPPIPIRKKIRTTEELIPMNHGRVTLGDDMAYLYSPAEWQGIGRARDLWEGFCSDMDAVLLFVDCTTPESWEQSAKLYKVLQLTSPKPCIIIANKAQGVDSAQIGRLRNVLTSESPGDLITQFVTCNGANQESAFGALRQVGRLLRDLRREENLALPNG